MVKNLLSLGLLRNGKVYQNKQLAIQGLTQTATNDGVAKLARYLDPTLGGDPIIRTLVGFYADANEMEDAVAVSHLIPSLILMEALLTLLRLSKKLLKSMRRLVQVLMVRPLLRQLMRLMRH